MKMAMEEIYASLRFTGSGVLPSEITKYLDLLPSRSWQRGDCFVDAVGKLRQRYNGLWLYDNKGLTFKRPVGHIRHMMNLIQNRLASWRDSHDNVRVDLCLDPSSKWKFPSGEIRNPNQMGNYMAGYDAGYSRYPLLMYSGVRGGGMLFGALGGAEGWSDAGSVPDINAGFNDGVVEKAIDDAMSDPFVQTIFAVIDLFD